MQCKKMTNYELQITCFVFIDKKQQKKVTW